MPFLAYAPAVLDILTFLTKNIEIIAVSQSKQASRDSRRLFVFPILLFFMRLAAVGEKKMYKCRVRLCSIQQHTGFEQVSIYCKHKFAVHQLGLVFCDGKAQAASFSISGGITSRKSFHELVSGDVKLLA